MFFPQTDKRHLSSTERTPMLALTSVRALMSYSEASAPNGCDPWSTRAEYDLDCPFTPTPTKPASSGVISVRSEEHTSELQSLMRISYAVFCLKKKNT